MKWRTGTYWIAQILGWSVYFFGNLLSVLMNAQELGHDPTEILNVFLVPTLIMVILGIAVTHGFRYFAHQFGWNKFRVGKLVPRVIISAIGLGILYTGIVYFIAVFMVEDLSNVLNLDNSSFFNSASNFTLLFFLWQLIYFSIHVFENFKAAEINNLKLQAANTQMELDQLRNKMNPHFIFNSLNSVRALIDEDPAKAKTTINLLSALLRSSFLKNDDKMVPFADELELVKKYISVEKVRFEERIDVQYDIDPDSLQVLFPPFILQTLVENAIKHGVNKRKDGGLVAITTSVKDQELHVEIRNTGDLEMKKNTGYGLRNTQERIRLLFDDKASFSLTAADNMVYARLKIPINKSE